MWHRGVHQYTKHHHRSLVPDCSHQFQQVGAFAHVIYPSAGLQYKNISYAQMYSQCLQTQWLQSEIQLILIDWLSTMERLWNPQSIIRAHIIALDVLKIMVPLSWQYPKYSWNAELGFFRAIFAFWCPEMRKIARKIPSSALATSPVTHAEVALWRWCSLVTSVN